MKNGELVPHDIPVPILCIKFYCKPFGIRNRIREARLPSGCRKSNETCKFLVKGAPKHILPHFIFNKKAPYKNWSLFPNFVENLCFRVAGYVMSHCECSMRCHSFCMDVALWYPFSVQVGKPLQQITVLE